MESHPISSRYPRAFQLTDSCPPSLKNIWTRFEELPARLLQSRIALLVIVDILDAAYWRRRTFTIDELVVLALVYNDDATSTTIAQWIGRYFYFYIRNDLAPHTIGARSPAEKSRQMFCLDVRKSLCKLELPVCWSMGNPHSNSRRHNIDLPAAHLFIRGMLTRGHAKTEPFRFLDLPLELRMMVYDMVLGFPDSGIVIRRENLIPMIYTATRRINRIVTYQQWLGLGYYNLHHGKSLGTYLAILATCKQLYAEAMPFFYSKNCFVFWDLSGLAQFLEATSPLRLARVRHIMFDYRPEDHDSSRMPHIPLQTWYNSKQRCWDSQSPYSLSIERTCKILAQMEGLRSLEIGFSETFWREKSRPRKLFSDPLKVTGLRILRKMRGLEKVVFHGDCDIVRADLVSEMMKPKEVRKGSRKQKAREKHELKMVREKERKMYVHSLDHYEDSMDELYGQYEGWGNA